MERGSSKGKRLIILHAITKDGPVGKRAALNWNKDMPHPMEYLFGSQIQGDPFGAAQWRIYQGAAKEFGSATSDSSP